jgi:hypothetical protein
MLYSSIASLTSRLNVTYIGHFLEMVCNMLMVNHLETIKQYYIDLHLKI